MTKNNTNQGPEQFESLCDFFLDKLGEVVEALANDESVEKNETPDNGESKEAETWNWNIVIYNDDVKTFGEAAEALVDALGLEIRQATDLAVLIDSAGSAPVKVAGSYAAAVAIFEELRKTGLTVGLESA